MKHRFSYAQRYAIWDAYEGRCFYCEQPLEFQDFAVDHILPEWLLSDVNALTRIREDYSLGENFPGFQINDFCNWVPTHFRKCNTRKGHSVYPRKLTLLLLTEASKRQSRAAAQHQQLISLNKRGRVLGQLASAIEQEHVSVADVAHLISDLQQPEHDPLVLAFSMQMTELENHELSENIPSEYASLCDWLELDLVRHLRSIIKARFHYTEPSERWGDGLGVRIVFLGSADSDLEHFERPWWDILESGSFSETFGRTYDEAFPYEVTQEYFGMLEADEATPLPAAS